MGSFHNLVVAEQKLMQREGFVKAINLRDEQRDFLKEHTIEDLCGWKHPITRSRLRKKYQELFGGIESEILT